MFLAYLRLDLNSKNGQQWPHISLDVNVNTLIIYYTNGGVAMGSPLGSVDSNLYMAHRENKMRNVSNRPTI